MATGLGDEQLWLCPTLDNATPFNDLSSQGNNGTAQGGLSTITDTSAGGAYAYDFDGVDDYINCGSGIISNTGFSVSCWFNADTASGNGCLAGNYHWQVSQRNWNLRRNGNRITFLTSRVGSSTSGNVQINSTSTLSTGTWYHVVGTWTPVGGMKLYFNGVLESTGFQASMSSTTEPIVIGSYSTAPDGLFEGLEDDIRIYDRALTQSEITHLATARGIEGRPFDGLGDEQLWLCPSLENSPNDLSGNNNNGVYQNGMGTVTDTGSGGSRAYDTSSAGDLVKCVYQGTDSISGWFYISSANRGASTSIFTGTDVYSGGNWGDGLYWNNTTVYVKKNNTTGGWVNLPSGSVPAGAWFHYASVRTASGMSYYVDGVEVQTANTSTTDRGDFFIGNATGTSPQGDFRSDDIRAYTRALTQSEISWLATERGVLGTPPEGLGDEQLWLCPSIQDSPNDISANNNHGTYVGGMGTIADTAEGGSRAYDFDGTDDYIDCGDILDGTTGGQDTAVTYSSWMRLDSYSNNNNAYGTAWMGKCDAVSRGGYVLGNINGVIGFYRYPNNSTGAQYLGTDSSVSQIPLSTWKHVAVTYSGCETTGCTSVYIDGVAVSVTETESSYGTGMGANTDTFKIGTTLRLLTYKRMMNGQLDDIRVYDRVLTQDEITHLASQRGVLGAPALPEGLGDEYGWWCPSLDANADGLTNLTGGADAALKLAGQFGVVSDTGSGGTKAWEGTGVGNSGINTGVVPLVDNDFSMSCWFKQDLGAGGYQEIMAVEDPSTRDYLQCRVSNGAMSTDFNGLTMSEPTDLRGGWHHVVVTLDYSGNAASQYIDGVLVNSGTMSNGWSQNLGEWEIGSQGRSGTLVWDGLLDDSRIYNRVLTQAEITHLASQRGVLGSPATTQYNAFVTHAFRQLFQTRLR